MRYLYVHTVGIDDNPSRRAVWSDVPPSKDELNDIDAGFLIVLQVRGESIKVLESDHTLHEPIEA